MYSPFSLFLFPLLGFMHTSIIGAGDPIATKEKIVCHLLWGILDFLFFSLFSFGSLLISALNGIHVRGGFFFWFESSWSGVQGGLFIAGALF